MQHYQALSKKSISEFPEFIPQAVCISYYLRHKLQLDGSYLEIAKYNCILRWRCGGLNELGFFKNKIYSAVRLLDFLDQKLTYPILTTWDLITFSLQNHLGFPRFIQNTSAQLIIQDLNYNPSWKHLTDFILMERLSKYHDRISL